MFGLVDRQRENTHDGWTRRLYIGGRCGTVRVAVRLVSHATSVKTHRPHVNTTSALPNPNTSQSECVRMCNVWVPEHADDVALNLNGQHAHLHLELTYLNSSVRTVMTWNCQGLVCHSIPPVRAYLLSHPTSSHPRQGMIPRAIARLFDGMLGAESSVEFTCQATG